MGRSRRVVVVDRDRELLDDGARLLAEHDVVTARSLDEAVERVTEHPVDLVVLGPSHATPSGVEAAGVILAADPGVAIVLAADITTNRILKIALRTGLADVIDTPLTAHELDDALERAPVRTHTAPVVTTEPTDTEPVSVDVYLEAGSRTLERDPDSGPGVDLESGPPPPMEQMPGDEEQEAEWPEAPAVAVTPRAPGEVHDTGLDAGATVRENDLEADSTEVGARSEDPTTAESDQDWEDMLAALGLPLVEVPSAVGPQEGEPSSGGQGRADPGSPRDQSPNGAGGSSGGVGSPIDESEVPPRPEGVPPMPADPSPGPHPGEEGENDESDGDASAAGSFFSFLRRSS